MGGAKDNTFPRPNHHNSHCRIRIYLLSSPDESSDVAVVVATELPDNKGRSITNDVEILIKLVCDRYKLNPQSTIWIEHYPVSKRMDESFDKVSLPVVSDFEPCWLRLSREEVERLIGCELED